MSSSSSSSSLKRGLKRKSSASHGRSSRSRTGGAMRNLWPRSKPLVGEVKSVDAAIASTFTVAGAITNLYDTAAGTDFYQRVGRKVNLKSLRIRGVLIANNGAGAIVGDILRVVVFSDNQFIAGAAPVGADVLQDVSSAGATATSPLTGLNLNNRDRFKVLRDETFQMPAKNQAGLAITEGIEGGNTCEIKNFNMFIKLKGFEVSHSGAAAGTISKGGIFILCISAVNANQWEFLGQARTRFTDV